MLTCIILQPAGRSLTRTVHVMRCKGKILLIMINKEDSGQVADLGDSLQDCCQRSEVVS